MTFVNPLAPKLSSELTSLSQDSYLVSKMDKDHFVELSVIAEFKLIKQLTTDLDLILTSIKDSDKVNICCLFSRLS